MAIHAVFLLMSMISTVLQTAEAKERTYRCNANKEESKSGDYVCTETTVEVPVFVYFLRYQRNHSPESHLPISEFSGSAPPAPPTPIYLPQSGKVSAQNIIIEVPRATLTDPAGIGIQVCKPSCNFSWGAWQICKLEEYLNKLSQLKPVVDVIQDGTAKASGQLKVCPSSCLLNPGLSLQGSACRIRASNASVMFHGRGAAVTTLGQGGWD
eukprot:665757-Rhodomonas_salina.1